MLVNQASVAFEKTPPEALTEEERSASARYVISIQAEEYAHMQSQGFAPPNFSHRDVLATLIPKNINVFGNHIENFRGRNKEGVISDFAKLMSDHFVPIWNESLHKVKVAGASLEALSTEMETRGKNGGIATIHPSADFNMLQNAMDIIVGETVRSVANVTDITSRRDQAYINKSTILWVVNHCDPVTKTLPPDYAKMRMEMLSAVPAAAPEANA